MHVSFINVFVIVVSCVFGGILDARGDSFSDLFQSLDENRWRQEIGPHHCGTTACVIAVKENFQFRSRSVGKRENVQEMQMWMKNDCNKEACCHKHVCTPYTSAELSSVEKYAFGTFVFVGKPAFSVVGYVNNYSCFSLRARMPTYHDLSLKMGINLCFPSQEKNVIEIMVRYGDQTHRQKLEVSYNTRDFAAPYRIDWLPDHIAFHIGTKLVHIVTLKEVMIPDNGLHIRLSLMPQQTPDESDHAFPKFQKDEVATVMIINQILYKKYDVAIEHIELHKKHSKRNFYITKVSCSVVLLLTFIIVHICKTDKRSDMPEGYNHLMESEKDNAKNIACI